MIVITESRKAAAVERSREVGFRVAASEHGVSVSALQAWRKQAGVSVQGDLLDNAPFRELCERTIEREDISWDDLARRVGYASKSGPAAHNLLRLFKGDRQISYAQAAKAIDRSPTPRR